MAKNKRGHGGQKNRPWTNAITNINTKKRSNVGNIALFYFSITQTTSNLIGIARTNTSLH